ncbi:MAG TPA: STAS/SEC14 domain-containing protein [Bacteroidia bacterium]|nr:STAS/SEC14 domain-containing protein [Bacteroidia bacterium]
MSSIKKYRLQVIEPRIIRLSVIENIELEQQDAKEIITDAVALANGETYAILFDANSNGTISFEAREEFAQSKKRIAAAIVTNSLANKLLGNFFVNFHKPKTPSRMFTEDKEAIEWLREQIKEK